MNLILQDYPVDLINNTALTSLYGEFAKIINTLELI